VWPRFRDGWSYDTNAFGQILSIIFIQGQFTINLPQQRVWNTRFNSMAFTGSLIWNIGEWRERTSANDMFFTSFGAQSLASVPPVQHICEQCCRKMFMVRFFLFYLIHEDKNRTLDRWFDEITGQHCIHKSCCQAFIEKINKK